MDYERCKVHFSNKPMAKNLNKSRQGGLKSKIPKVHHPVEPRQELMIMRYRQ
jgi:hypothetical protein